MSEFVEPAHRFFMALPRFVGFLLIAVVLVNLTHEHGADACVATFYEFEKAAVIDSPSNLEALVAAFYETNKPVPLSVQVVYHINSSNGTDSDSYISTDPQCPQGKEMWLWVPSPVFLFMEPTKLNLCALFTLNYFSQWDPPQAHLYVPDICNISHNRFNFLNDLTSRVSTHC
ncbi:MAG: hypothetical protein MPL62_15115 [Alphaproteobacteria bacterium]|nr:hypothetical protein [Alphaproteobacteria bacterium]